MLLAGGWSLPAAALEGAPEPVAIETAPAQPQFDSRPEEPGAIASPLAPVTAFPAPSLPAVATLEAAVVSLAVTPPVAAPMAGELAGIAPLVPTIFPPAALAPEFSEVGPVRSRDRLGAGFAQAEIIQAEGETVPLTEEAIQLDPAETDLDGDNVPAGDLLESVDGLEDSGIAGEGTITEAESEPAAEAEASEGAGSEADTASELPLGEGAIEAEATEAGEAEAGEFDSEEFDSEAFEAEEFDFDEDELENTDQEPTEAATEGETEGDPELGILRLRERPLAKQKQPVTVPVFLVGNVGYIGNGNTLAGVDPVNDRLFRSGLSLIASPRLSRRTALIASVQGNLYRYDELSRLDYNEVRLQASLRHVMTRRVYGDLGWTHRQLFLQEEGDRFLSENAAFASLTRRDPLTRKTSLTSFYNLRVSFADPETSSRLRNTLGLSLRHELTPALQASLTGRATLTNFTQQSRQDFYTQALAQLSYRISKNVRLSLFGSLTRGNSSNRRVDFDNSTLGVSLSGNVKLF